jgi:hypothetical protein
LVIARARAATGITHNSATTRRVRTRPCPLNWSAKTNHRVGMVTDPTVRSFSKSILTASDDVENSRA